MIGLLNSALVEAAAFERDRRLERAPDALAQPGADRHQIIVSCQCWSAIVTWLDTDRFESFAGGEDLDRPDAPIIRWPELEDAAQRALVGAKQNSDAERVQRVRLAAIHARLARMRRDVDFINDQFRARRDHSTREGIAA